MKGLLSGTNKFPGIVVMRKRRRGGVQIVARKKSRKSQDRSLGNKDDDLRTGFANEEVQSGASTGRDSATESEGDVPAGQLTETRICYDGDKATVTLRLKQIVALDGWAMVRLLAGRATVHGYSLSPGVEVLLCSNSKLAAVVAVESQLSSLAMEYLIRNDDPSSSQSSEMSDSLEKPMNGADAFGCTLEFQSYRGGSAVTVPSFDGVNGDESPTTRTFRVEIAAEDESERSDIPKRKRDEMGSGGSEGGEEEEMSSSGDDGEEEEEEDEKVEEWKAGQGLVDMEVDEYLKADDILLAGGRDRKKLRKDVKVPLNATVIPDSWWSAAKNIVYQCDANSIPAPPTEESGKPLNGSSVAQTQRPQIVAVIGPKNAGKSTFARFLLNFLLNSHEAVGYLDTDVGQPEFTVPGCLSLHIVREPIFGSPVLHLRNPERSFFYGDVSPKGDPEMYSRSVGALFDYFQRKYASGKSTSTQEGKCRSSVVPLVINTHGWIKGIGYDVLVDILRHTSPTHVVQFTTRTENKNLPAGKFWESSIDSDKTALLYIESALEGSDNRPLVRVKTPSDHLRGLRIMAYFRQCFSKDPLPFPYREDRLFSQTAMGLVRCPPYQVPISAVKIWHLHSQVSESQSLYSVNGTLVGLGVGFTQEKANKAHRLHASCVGLGIVRGIDVEKGLLYIITPLPVDLLRDVDTLLQGRVEIPVSLLQAKGYASPYLCHNSVAIEGTGSVHMKPRKRFPRVGA